MVPQSNQKSEGHINWPRVIILILTLLCFVFIGITMYMLGARKVKTIAVDFSIQCDDSAAEPHKYQFLSKQLSDYICDLSSELDINPDLIVAILMVENPEFNTEAVHRNENGTVDCGLFQLNDRYIWTTFRSSYWFDNIELDPFNWKHNTYIAMHHIKSLQDQLKLTDDVVMAYNCGIGAVMNGAIPAATKVYLAKVKNNIILLKGVEE